MFGEDPQNAQQGGGSPYLSLEDCPASVLFRVCFLKAELYTMQMDGKSIEGG